MILLDVYASTIEGSINAIQKRIVVSNDDFNRSREAYSSFNK